MDLLILTTLSISLIIIGGIALKHDYKSQTNRYFFLFTFFTAIWVLVNFLSNYSHIYIAVLWFNRFIFVSTTLLVYFLYLFSRSYPHTKEANTSKYKVIGILSTVLVATLSLTHFVVDNVVLKEGYSEITFGLGIGVYLIHFIVFFLLFSVTIIKKYKKTTGIEKAKLQYLGFGIAIAGIGAIITNLVLPIFFESFAFSSFGPFFLLAFIGLTATSIVKHRLFGVKFIIGKSMNYLLLIIVPYISFYLVIAFHNKLWGSVYTRGAYISGIFIAVGFSSVYWYLKQKSQDFFLNKFVYRGFNPVLITNSYSKKISTELDLEALIRLTTSTLQKSLKISSVGVVLFKPEERQLLYEDIKSFTDNKAELTKELLAVIDYWDEIDKNTILVKEELEVLTETDSSKSLKKVYDLMSDRNIEVVLPLNRKVKLNGLVILGKKSDTNVFSAEELTFLEGIVINTSVAVGRALLYKEVEGFNDTLKLEVQKATKEIRQQRDDLEETLRKERDMLDILGHELRTPLSIVRNAIGIMVSARSKGDLTDEKLDKYLAMSDENVKREIILLERMLSTTKLGKEDIQLSLENVDMVDAVNDSLDGLRKKATDKNLSVVFDPPLKDFMVYADRERVQEITDNLIDNAIKYTQEGTVNISLSEDGDNIKFEVVDTGEGISEEDLKHLGKKFFRANTYLSSQKEGLNVVRPGGTGLGLYVVFALIKAMNGEYEIKSELGKGSTFTVKLPKYNGQAIEKKDKPKSLDRFAQLKAKMEAEKKNS